MENHVLAQSLMKIAEELRKEHDRREEVKMIKCAQILTAARGLNYFRSILGR
jgi:hypothetical protein